MDIKSLTISQRLRLFLDNLGIDQQTFADTLGISRQVLSNALNGRTKYPKSDFLVSLIDNYPNFNIYWLLTGKGEMFTNETPISSNELKHELEKLQKENSKLKDKIIELLEKA
ncbi:MAG: helix-turn-helix domain-containing protein [Saprospiraceae bacterium]